MPLCQGLTPILQAAEKQVTQNPKTDTEEIRGKLGQKSGRGDEDDARVDSQ